MKKADKTLVFTTLLCLLPMAAGLFLWDQLPQEMPIHWNAAGQVDNYGSRALAVVGLPCIMAGAHLLVHLLLRTDPRRENMSPALRTITYWILPGLCILLCAVTYMAALGIPVRVEVIVPLAVGVLFMAIGNYLPKCQQNYTMGIRTPWTLNSPENWARTHRVGGWCFMAGDLLMLLCALPGMWWLLYPAIAISALAPVIYSYLLYRKGI